MYFLICPILILGKAFSDYLYFLFHSLSSINTIHFSTTRPNLLGKIIVINFVLVLEHVLFDLRRVNPGQVIL